MNKEKLIDAIEYFFSFSHHGNYRSAASYISMVFYSLSNLSVKEQSEINKQLEIFKISDALILGAKQQIQENTETILRIISVGSRWNDDELLYLVQLRLDTDMLLSFLERNQATTEHNFVEIDFWFKTLAISTVHRQSFQYAVKMIRKNCILPINHTWLFS